MRVGFITCVQLGLSCMQAIYDAGGELVFAGSLLDTQAPNKSGRVYLDGFCAARGIPLTKFRNVNDPQALDALRAADLDWLMIIGWSQIAREEALATPRLGVLGMHPTLLPVGRGRAAVPWAILLGLEETGVTLFKLDGGVDTGPILAQVRLPLAPRETSTTLYQRVNEAHRALILEHWRSIASGTVTFTRQDDSKASEWPGRTPEQGRLDHSMTVVEADRLVRAATRPYPGAFMDIDGRRLRIWEASPETGSRGFPLRFRDGELRVVESEWERLPD
jgi:methionyl-tRNA formyltransferase